MEVSHSLSHTRAGMDFLQRYSLLLWLALASTLGFVPSAVYMWSQLTITHAVHAVSSLSWILLLILQVNLIKSSNTKLHRRIGWLSIVVFLMMLCSSVYMLRLTAGVAMGKGAIFQMVYWVDYLLLPLAFIFYCFGLAYRKNLNIHFRLMCLTSVALICPGLGRVIYAIFLYPFDLPVRWFFEPMMLSLIGFLIWLGYSERWKFWPTRVASCVVGLTFVSAYFVQDAQWYVHLVKSYLSA